MGIVSGFKKFLNKIEEKRAIEDERRARYSEIAKEAEAQGRGHERGRIIEQRRYENWKREQRDPFGLKRAERRENEVIGSENRILRSHNDFERRLKKKHY